MRVLRVIAVGLLVLVILARPWAAVAGQSVAAARSPGASSETIRPRSEATSRPGRAGLMWPVQGKVISRFGAPRGFRTHRGVDIKVPRGTPIRAAAAGTVVYSGRQSSFGRMVTIAHPNGVSTVYAHNSANFVRAGDRVQAGAPIGAVGHTGHATTNHLHFEVRRHGAAVNPLPLLPRTQPVARAAPRHGGSTADREPHTRRPGPR
jgi:lipoprotein NlpD